MIHVKKSRVINGDPDTIWRLINQTDRFPEWMPDVIEASVISKSKKNKNGLGRRQLLKMKMPVGEGETVQEVIAWDPPNRITWQHLQDRVDGKEVKHAREIKTTLSISNENGNVTFRMVGSWIPVGVSGKLMSRMMKRTVARNFDQALQNLEELVIKETKKSNGK